MCFLNKPSPLFGNQKIGEKEKKTNIVSKVYYVVLHIILLFPCNFCLLFVFNLMLRNTKLYV